MHVNLLYAHVNKLLLRAFKDLIAQRSGNTRFKYLGSRRRRLMANRADEIVDAKCIIAS